MEAGKLISHSLWNTYVFKVVDKVPDNFYIWNVPPITEDNRFIPFCRLLHPEDPDDYTIVADDVLAVESDPETVDLLQHAAHRGIGCYNDAVRAINSKRRGKVADTKRKLAEQVLPILKQIYQ